MAKQNTIIADFKGKVDFGIITIREDEFEAILQRFQPEQLVHGRQTYAISRLNTIKDEEYVIASVRCPEQGNGEGQKTAFTLIEELGPQWILLVGIAGAVPAYEYTIGDVLLATRLHDFCVSASIEDAEGKETRQFAAKGGPMLPSVQSILAALPAIGQFLDKWNTKAALTVDRPLTKITNPSDYYGDDKWKKKVKDCLNKYFGKNPIRQQPRAFTGSVASSDTLVKDTHLIQEWLESARQINGVEMELAGVCQAAWPSLTPVLAIRGISDIVGFKRSHEWIGYACHAAAAYTAALLPHLPIIPLSNPSHPASNKVEEAEPPLTLSQPVGIFKKPVPNIPPVPKQETLYSNLVEVEYFPETLYTAQTQCKKDGEIWRALKNSMYPPFYDWVYKGKTLYAFHDFSDPVWKDLCDLDTIETQSTCHWSESDDKDRVNIFIELLRGCLNELAYTRDLDYIYKERVGGKLRPFKYLCYAPTSVFHRSARFEAEDVKDVAGFIERLKTDDMKISKHIVASLPSQIRRSLKQYPRLSEKRTATVVSALITCLNSLLKSSLYKSGLFDGVYFRKHTWILLDEGPNGEKEIEQINRMLLEDAYKKELVHRYFADRVMKIKSLVKKMPREVFGAHFSNITGLFRYYRHNAFRSQFLRLNGKWYLEIIPTYHYTTDGYAVYKYYEDEVKGIKRIEDNEAIFRQVIFWSRVLKGAEPEPARHIIFDEDEERADYPYLRLGDLLEYSLDYGIIDDAWKNKEPIIKTGKGSSRRGRRSRKPPEELSVSKQDSLI
jgi:nucleoside phosphorylase